MRPTSRPPEGAKSSGDIDNMFDVRDEGGTEWALLISGMKYNALICRPLQQIQRFWASLGSCQVAVQVPSWLYRKLAPS
jgi:hypothetical protein